MPPDIKAAPVLACILHGYAGTCHALRGHLLFPSVAAGPGPREALRRFSSFLVRPGLQLECPCTRRACRGERTPALLIISRLSNVST